MSFPKVLQGRKDNYDMHGRNRLGYDSGFREGWKQVPFLKMNRFTYCKAWFWQPPNHKHVSRSPRQQSPDTMIDWKLKSIGSCGAIFKRNQGGHNPWMSWTQHLWHLLKTKNKKNTLWKQVPLEQKTSNYINSWKCPKNVPFFQAQQSDPLQRPSNLSFCPSPRAAWAHVLPIPWDTSCQRTGARPDAATGWGID